MFHYHLKPSSLIRKELIEIDSLYKKQFKNNDLYILKFLMFI